MKSSQSLRLPCHVIDAHRYIVASLTRGRFCAAYGRTPSISTVRVSDGWSYRRVSLPSLGRHSPHLKVPEYGVRYKDMYLSFSIQSARTYRSRLSAVPVSRVEARGDIIAVQEVRLLPQIIADIVDVHMHNVFPVIWEC